MSFIVTQESFASIAACWNNPHSSLTWDSVFVLPSWLKVWWHEFQPDAELYLAAVREEANIIGIAPLKISGSQASFIGSVDVCDYQDFMIKPAKEHDFFLTLLADLKRRGVTSLKLEHVRPESTTMTALLPLLQSQGLQGVARQDDVSVEMDLPSSWEEYLENLSGKQRHEVRRKLRRLNEAGKWEYTETSQATPELMATFFKLFITSREEKARFLTNRMTSFFKSVAEEIAALGILRLGMLKIEGTLVAMFLGFNYHDALYLYNNGYNPAYSEFSVGLLAKVFGIRESIRQGLKKWNFLKGNEPYKYELGGKAIPLYSCQINLT